MSEVDLILVRQQIRIIKQAMSDLFKEGTSKGNNREKYQKLKKRMVRLKRWERELKKGK